MKRKASTLSLESALLTTEQAAAHMSIASETVRRLVRAKLISFVAITPNAYRLRREDLEEYINARRHQRPKGV